MRSILDVPARRRTSTVAQAGLPARVAVTVARVVDPAVACEARGETATSGAVCASNRRPGSRHDRAVRRPRLPRPRRDRVRRPRRDRRRARPARPTPRGAHLCADRRARPGPGGRARRARHRRRASGSRSSRTTARACSSSFFGVSGFGRVLVPINFRLSTDEVAYIVEHSGASVLSRRPRADDGSLDVAVRAHASCSATRRRPAVPATAPSPERLGAGRGRDRDDQLHERHDRPAQGRAAHAPQHLDQRHDVRLHAGVNDRDVYLHTLPMFHCNGWGMPFAHDRHGRPHVVLRKVDGAEILRRVERARRHGDVRGARGRRTPCSTRPRGWDGEIPGRGRVRIVVAGAPPPTQDDRARRDRARLGVHPDLRPHRDLAAAHDQPHPRRVGRPRPRGARGQARPGRRARARRAAARSTDDGEVLARSQRRPRGLLGTAGGDRATRSTTAGSTPATAARSTTTATSRSATARRT